MKKIIEDKSDGKDLAVDGKSAKGGLVKGRKKDSVKKRKRAKKQDKMARWSGMILFVILMIVGFLMWVAGEVSVEPVVKMPSESRVVPSVSGQGRVVVE